MSDDVLPDRTVTVIADDAVEGDLHEVVPAINEALEE